MATKRIATLDIASGGQKSLKAGEFVPPKGKQLKGMILEMIIPVKNATGGAVAGLSAQQKLDYLNCFQFNVSYGKGLERKPFIAVSGSRMRSEARDAYNSEIEGYSDATTGFGRNFGNGATTNATIYLPIPLGRRADLPDSEQHLFGMGRSQARTLEIEVKRIVDTTQTANLTIDSAQSVTVKLWPDYESVKGDVWGLVPEYREKDEVADEVTLPNDGLLLRLGERTAAHAASALTDFDVMIDAEEIYKGVAPAQVTRELNDDPWLASGGNISDVEVILYKPKFGTSLRWLQTGKPTFRQNKKDLATAKLNVLYVPYLTDAQIKAEVQSIADKVRGKTIRAANAFMVAGLDLPKRTAGLPFFHMFDQDDREFEQAPGWVANPNQTEPVLTVPESTLSLAKAKVAAYEAAGEKKVASDVSKQLAVMVPGAISNGRGTRQGFSGVINRIGQFFR